MFTQGILAKKITICRVWRGTSEILSISRTSSKRGTGRNRWLRVEFRPSFVLLAQGKAKLLALLLMNRYIRLSGVFFG